MTKDAKQGRFMHLDVVNLSEFYYRNPLGRAVQSSLRKALHEYWPHANRETVVGFGFATPLLRPYIASARRVVALMPGPQGVIQWPADQPNRSVLCEESAWPIETGSVDKLVLMHGLETSENPGTVLHECYRTLGPGGRIIFIVPNRVGLWSRSDKTPFGYGRPYSLSQLETQLKECGFTIERANYALYQPPSTRPIWRRLAIHIQRIRRVLPFKQAGGGVLIVEACKQIPAPRRPGLGEQVKRPLKILEGITTPEPRPCFTKNPD